MSNNPLNFFSTLSEPLLSLWRNRELYRRVLARDIQASFRGSVLGLAWIILIPLVLVGIYTFVFGVILKSSWALSPRSPIEVPLIYFASLMVFAFFMETVTRAANVVRDSATYVTKVIFPVDILAFVVTGTSFFKFCISFALLLVFLLLFTGTIPLLTLLVPLLVLPLVLMSVGVAWAFMAIGAYVRDLSFALQALAPVLLFVSPVFYSIEQVPAPYRILYTLNPMTFVLENLRGALFFDRGFPLVGYALYLGASLVVFALGYTVFQRLRAGFADVV